MLDNKTPYEMLFGQAPEFDLLRVFGCLCFAHNQKANGDKFAPRSRKCIFVGYPTGKKRWKLYDLETSEIFVSQMCCFLSKIFLMPPLLFRLILPTSLLAHLLLFPLLRLMSPAWRPLLALLRPRPRSLTQIPLTLLDPLWPHLLGLLSLALLTSSLISLTLLTAGPAPSSSADGTLPSLADPVPLNSPRPVSRVFYCTSYGSWSPY